MLSSGINAVLRLILPTFLSIKFSLFKNTTTSPEKYTRLFGVITVICLDSSYLLIYYFVVTSI